MDKLTMDIGFANLVAVKSNESTIFQEFHIYLEDKVSGLVHQDIALVRTAANEDFQQIPDTVECLVWGDSENEDYTHKFAIKHFEEDGAT